MLRCHYVGCGWHALAPSERAAREQLDAHIAAAHVSEVDAEVPDGMVQVKTGDDDEWRTVPPEEAARLHEREHDAGGDDPADDEG